MASGWEKFFSGNLAALSEQEQDALWNSYRELFLPARHFLGSPIDQLGEIPGTEMFDQVIDVPKHV